MYVGKARKIDYQNSETNRLIISYSKVDLLVIAKVSLIHFQTTDCESKPQFQLQLSQYHTTNNHSKHDDATIPSKSWHMI